MFRKAERIGATPAGGSGVDYRCSPAPPCPELGANWSGFRSYDDYIAYFVLSDTFCTGTGYAVQSGPETFDNRNGLFIEPLSRGALFDWHLIWPNQYEEIFAARIGADRTWICPAGFGELQNGTDLCARPMPSVSPKNQGPDCNVNDGGPCGTAGDPVNTGTGNQTETETDYVGTGPFPLVFSRTYNSLYGPYVSSMAGGDIRRRTTRWNSTTLSASCNPSPTGPA